MTHKLDEKTTIPIWAVLVAVPTLSIALLTFGVTAWQTQANAKAIDKLTTSDEKQNDEFKALLIEIKEDLATIKAILSERGKK